MSTNDLQDKLTNKVDIHQILDHTISQLKWDRYKCLELKKEICDHNKFNILIEKLGNGELNLITVVLLSTEFSYQVFITRTYIKDLNSSYYFFLDIKKLKNKQLMRYEYKSEANIYKYIKLNTKCKSIRRANQIIITTTTNIENNQKKVNKEKVNYSHFKGLWM
ncbi:hypothetical protein H8356DRAFT_1350713 [Neocallimastix lanati (nom. inval.)]|nr:hypothetical protein H8356DRAFT_1350713 [Neocallimastix sp. JGI-2020a]